MTKQTFTGTLEALQQNRPDGSYPSAWRHFHVKAANGVNVHVEADTGGARDALLKLEGQTVSIEANYYPETRIQTH